MKKWKSLYIYFISGTGNAKASSGWIRDEAEKAGLKTVVQQIDRQENILMPDKNKKPLIGFAFPTHGFNGAPIMIRFIAGFPRGLGREVFLLNTRAGMKFSKIFLPGISGVALLLPAFILWLKGYKCIGFRPVDLPSNWIPLHPGLKKKVIESIFLRCERIVRNFAVRILSGKKVYTGLISIPVDLLISPIALGYYIGGRFFLSKTFIANNKCNNCGICIRECPTSSIKLVSGRPYWKLTCESCMRCLNFCPNKAIEAAHGMAAAFWIIFTAINTQIILLIINALNINPDIWWWKLTSQITGIACMILVTAVLYRIMHYAMGFKPIRYLVRFTSLTTLPFWRRYSFLKNVKKKAISADQGTTA
jgi:Pyruvate/2-oxoacid:ferredoxin oxidoreductase delta subunit